MNYFTKTGNIFSLTLLLALFLSFNLQAKDVSFFEPDDESSINLPDDEFYPQGKKFFFTLFSVLSPDLEKMKADGFTAIGPYYGEQKKSGVLDKANATGLKCLYRVGKHIDFVKNPKYVMPTDEEIVEQIMAEILPVLDRKEIAVWYLGNEELRHWRPDEMRWLDIATQTIRELDPLKRPIWMYEPNHRQADSLAKTVVYQDYCGKGAYANLAGYQNNRIWVKWSIEQELEAIKLTKSKAIALCVPEMCCDPLPEFHSMIPKWCRHDVYCSLVNGAKGVAIWSGFRRSGLTTYDLYYQGYSSVSKELNGELGLGQVFLFGKKRDKLKVNIFDGVNTVTLKPGLGSIEGIKECLLENRIDDTNTDYSPISTIELSYKGDVYLFMVNSVPTYIKVVTSGLPTQHLEAQEILTRSTPEITDGIFKTELSPYDVKCFKFTEKK